jgi:hypothetical protein
MKRLAFIILIITFVISYANVLHAMGDQIPQQQLRWSQYYLIFEDYSGKRYYMRYLTDGRNLLGYREAVSIMPEAYCYGGLEYVGIRNGNYFYQCHPYER